MVAQRTDALKSSRAATQGIVVEATPRFLPDHSTPADSEWVFAYRIRITNEGEHPVRLVARRWVIRDAEGDEQVVEGEGVIGLQPRLEPGKSHEYESFCPLPTAWGTMEGHYVMRRDDGTEFDAVVARFFLVSSES